VEFENPIPLFEQSKAASSLDSEAAVIGRYFLRFL
jgi:hypothetical protein